jgi:hypothetical protein
MGGDIKRYAKMVRALRLKTAAIREREREREVRCRAG